MDALWSYLRAVANGPVGPAMMSIDLGLEGAIRTGGGLTSYVLMLHKWVI